MKHLEWLEKEFVKLESTIGVHSKMYELIEKAKAMYDEENKNTDEQVEKKLRKAIELARMEESKFYWTYYPNEIIQSLKQPKKD